MKTVEEHIKTKGKTPCKGEIRYKHKEGHVVWVIFKGSVIEWDGRGNPLRMIGTHTDITDLKGPRKQADW